jgi:hypothetical protein
MMRRLLLCSCAIALVTGFVATPPASAQQSVNFYVGGFFPKGASCEQRRQCLRDARGIEDVLYNNSAFLNFDVKDFQGFTAGAEYLVGLGDFLDAGLGVGVYSRTSPAIHDLFTFANGDLIEQDLKLRIVPITATVRVLPLGHHDAITPYFGGGVGIYLWRYTETGNFVDNQDNIFEDTFTGSDTTVGPVVLAGLRFPINNIGLGFEYRYQGGEGDLPPAEQFAGSKINLGGHNVFFTINVEF